MAYGTIDDFFTEIGVPETGRALTKALYGINQTYIAPIIELSDSVNGYTFFVRPQLNMRSMNLRRDRRFYPLLVKPSSMNIEKYIRVMLDPRLPYEIKLPGKYTTPDGKGYDYDIVDTPMVDKFNPFIPILSNSLKSISGFPDESVNVWQSSSGMKKEQVMMVDGTFEMYGGYDISCTFRNFIGDVTLKLIQYWVRYMSLVYEGVFSPYMDFMIENELDYCTRIYRLTTDRTGRFLNHISATGASIPKSVSISKVFDISGNEHAKNDSNKEISVSFSSVGFMSNDDILIKEFNETIAIFNPEFGKYLVSGDKDSLLVEVPSEFSNEMNYKAYPYIDDKNYTIKWLMFKEDLVELIKKKMNNE